MKTELIIAGKHLQLKRFPPSTDKSLQAWDTADEYLIHYCEEELTFCIDDSLLIVNDEFGALACYFNHLKPRVLTDSRMSEIASERNLYANKLSQQIEFLAPLQLSSLTQPPTVVLLKIPKSLAYLEYLLVHLQKLLTPSTRIVAAAKANAVTKSVLALFEKHIGSTRTSLAVKKSRLVLSQYEGKKSHFSDYKVIDDPALSFALYNTANVFCRDQIDIGARFLLSHLPRHLKRGLDLGCGNGILGCRYLAENPDASMSFVDESYLAIDAAKKTVSAAGYSDRASFYVSHSLHDLPAEAKSNYDFVLCNPPFHQKNTLLEDIAWQMFKDGKACLKPSGEMHIVANRHLHYLPKLRKLFGKVSIAQRNNKFTIYIAYRS